MSDYDPNQGGMPPSPQRDQETIKLLRFFFKEMCVNEKTTLDDAVHYLPEYLLMWVDKNLYLYDRDEVLQKAGAEEIGWEFMLELMNNPAGPLMLNPIWTTITLAHRGTPKYLVKLLHFVTLITWEDGTIFPLSVSLPSELITDGVINDAFLGTQVHAAFKQTIKLVVEEGLDVMHNKYGDNFGGETPFDILMGAFIKIIPQMAPEYHANLYKYLRLCQALVQPSVPPHVQAKINAVRAQRFKDKQPKSISGGFDTE